MPISVTFTPNETNKSILDAINSLFPQMQDMINMKKLYAYLVAFKVLTRAEAADLGPLLQKTNIQKNQEFLSLLDRKATQSQEMFVKALYRTKELDTHRELLELLSKKGVAINKDI